MQSWIIPARAGFTATSTVRFRRPADHPRSRGVYFIAFSCSVSVPGSSPLARGLRAAHVVRLITHRIIPARAGFTIHAALLRCDIWDHPRSRGVYCYESREL